MEILSAGYEFAHRDDYEGRRVLSSIKVDADSRNIEELEVGPDAEKYVGMATVQILVSTAESGEVGLAEDVVVQNDWRRMGIGGRLLASLELWSAQGGLRRLQLLADRENRAGLQFYVKNGWHETRLVCLRKTGSASCPADG